MSVSGAPAGERMGVVTALRSERRVLDRRHDHVRLSGMGAGNASAAAEALVAEGVSALVSFGLAGGLDPTLPSGSLVIADEVLLG